MQAERERGEEQSESREWGAPCLVVRCRALASGKRRGRASGVPRGRALLFRERDSARRGRRLAGWAWALA